MLKCSIVVCHVFPVALVKAKLCHAVPKCVFKTIYGWKALIYIADN